MSEAHEAHGGHGHDAHGGHDDHGDHGHHPRFIQHHYDDAQHQFDSGKLGIWLFLAQEVLFFSALFVAYILYRHHHPEIYSYAHKYLDVKYGAINTAVLIFSSLTAAWAVRAAQLNQKKLLVGCIAVTIGCAVTFLGIKYIEYSHKIHEHILFGRYFDPCVSSGGVPLLTKNNECAGHKSTVQWKDGSAAAGCYQDIDQDPLKPDVQADCAVEEVRLEGERVAQKTPITEQCPAHELGHGEGHEGHGAGKRPCWRVGFQPAVCPKKAGKEQYGIIVEYGDHKERGEDIRIDATCKPAPAAAAVADVFADPVSQPKLGQKAIAPPHKLTTHEEHELEAAGPPPEHTNMFFTIYFAMTGLHGIHVLFGVFVFLWLLIRAMKGHFRPDYFGPVDFAALYWHIVDLIWIFLFPLLYLIH